jgi:hypothetical protein
VLSDFQPQPVGSSYAQDIPPFGYDLRVDFHDLGDGLLAERGQQRQKRSAQRELSVDEQVQDPRQVAAIQVLALETSEELGSFQSG